MIPSCMSITRRAVFPILQVCGFRIYRELLKENLILSLKNILDCSNLRGSYSFREVICRRIFMWGC